MATREQCRLALKQHLDELSRLPYMHAIGIMRLSEPASDDCAIAVYVETAEQRTTLIEDPRTPTRFEIETEGGRVEVPVRIEVMSRHEFE